MDLMAEWMAGTTIPYGSKFAHAATRLTAQEHVLTSCCLLLTTGAEEEGHGGAGERAGGAGHLGRGGRRRSPGCVRARHMVSCASLLLIQPACGLHVALPFMIRA